MSAETVSANDPGESCRIQRPPGDSDDGGGTAQRQSNRAIETIFDVGYESEASEESESEMRAGELEGWEDIYEKIMEGAGLSNRDWKEGTVPELEFARVSLVKKEILRAEGESVENYLVRKLGWLSPSESLSAAWLRAAAEGYGDVLEDVALASVSTDKSMIPAQVAAQPMPPLMDLTERSFPLTNVPRISEAPRDLIRPRDVPSGTYKFSEITLPSFREALQDFEGKAIDRMVEAWRKKGKAKSSFREPLLMDLVDVLQPWALPHDWNTENHEACFALQQADVECGWLNWRAVPELVGPEFRDFDTLFRWRYGYSHKLRDFPRKLMIWFPLGSAFPWLMELHDGLIDEIEVKRIITRFYRVPRIPGHFEAVGGATRKFQDPPKPRRTTHKSGPTKLAINKFIDLDRDFGRFKLPKPDEHFEAAAIIGCMARSLKLPTIGVATDFSGWFNQLANAPREINLNGHTWVTPDGRICYDLNHAVQFGGADGPDDGQNSMNLTLHASRRLYAKREVQMEEAGLLPMGDESLSQGQLTPGVNAWRARRRALGLNGQQLRLVWDCGYIDDALAVALGLLRAILWATCFFHIQRILRIKVSHPKTLIGSTIKHLGVVAVYDCFLAVLPEDKLRRVVEWCGRLSSNTKAKVKEIESFAGTINFCSIVARGARKLLFRYYRSLSVSFSNRYRKRGLVVVSKMMRRDAAELRSIFIESGGVSTIPQDAWIEPDGPNGGDWYTDANRNHINLRKYSGMGGFYKGQFWYLKLERKYVLKLPVHVTEGVAALIQINLFGAQVRGAKIVERIDNKSIVDTFAEEKPSDPRLQELLSLRRATLAKFNILSKPVYIETSKNTLADLLSRGELEQFKLAARERGYETLTQITVPPHLLSILDLMVSLT